MGVRMIRFPEYGVTLNVYGGAIDMNAMRAHLKALEPTDVVRWINYIEPDVDARLDVAAIPELRRLIALRLKELNRGGPATVAFVAPPGAHTLTLSFWPHYLEADKDYPATAATFSSIEAACDWLGLSEGACAVLEAALGG